MATNETDVTEVVLAQHRDVAQRLSAVLNKTGDDRTAEFESLTKFLPVHEAAEQAVIYPALRALGDDGNRIAEARTQEEVLRATSSPSSRVWTPARQSSRPRSPSSLARCTNTPPSKRLKSSPC